MKWVWMCNLLMHWPLLWETVLGGKGMITGAFWFDLSVHAMFSVVSIAYFVAVAAYHDRRGE